MKKEKIIRSYKRKTKSGKVVTVKQHTAKYDAAEEMKKALAKKGAGSELATKQLTEKELKQVQDIVEENSELDEQYLAAFYPELSPKMIKAVMAAHKAKSATPKAKAANTTGKSPKSETPDLGFTDKEYKAWYHWDTESDPKNASALKVKKALIAAMGPKAYKKYEEDMTNSYSSRGHSKAFGTLPELVSARKEAAESFDKRAKEQGAKKKEATAKIKELSPKKGEIDYAKIDAYKGDPAKLSPKERQAWEILNGYHQSADEPRLRKLKSLSGLWHYIDHESKSEKAQQKALNFDKKFKRDSPETTLSKDELSSLRSDYGFSGIKKTADGKYSYVENDTGEKKVATVKQIRKMIAPFENAKGLSVMSASEYKQRSKKDKKG